jgi:hypothetical protein
LFKKLIVKQPSASVKPNNHGLSRVIYFVVVIYEIGILPTLCGAFKLKAFKNLLNWILREGNIIFPLNNNIIYLIYSFFCIIYLYTLGPCFIICPILRVSLIYCKTPKFKVPWTNIKDNSFRWLTKKQPSPSVKPINQYKNSSVGTDLLGLVFCHSVLKSKN